MRFWLWMTTGMITKQWVAIHRLHHQKTDKEGDPHSPVVHGIKNIFFRGVYYYYLAAKDAKMIVSYGKGTVNDKIERKLYTKHNNLGISLMLLINLVLFGPIGFLIWLAQILWVPFWAAGVINGVGHWFGYRNTETRDNSKNIFPLGIIIVGEELHNNHHHNPASPKLSEKWWEFDMGWMYIKILERFKLARLK